MKKRRIFRHPVGVFPMGARWYLACITVLMLLAVAAHLSIQIQAQKKAQWLLQQWGKQANVDIGDVHYHLLRNALIVQQIHILRPDASLSIAHMLIRANPGRLTSQSPRIGKIEIAGIRVQLWDTGSENNWQQDKYLNRIWQASRLLSVRDGELTLHRQGKNTAALKLTNLKLNQHYRHQQRKLDISAKIQHGNIHLQWQMNEQQHLSSGQLNWQDVEAQALSTTLGLRPASGLLTGAMDWSQTGSQISDINGRMHLLNASGLRYANRQLRWQGSRLNGDWQLQTQAQAWPLDAWADVLPQIDGRQMLSGLMKGDLQWSGRSGNWKIRAAHGMLRNTLFAASQDDKSTAWHFGQLEYHDIQIDQARSELQASSILLVDSVINMHPGLAASADQAGEPKSKTDWRVSAENIQVQDMALVLNMPQGKVTAAALHGKGSWKQNEILKFKLQTPDAIEKPAPPEDEKSALRLEHWRIGGTVQRRKAVWHDAALIIRARDVPLAKLRALLPLTGSKISPLGLQGYASLKMDVSVKNGAWQATGTATAEEVLLAHAGDRWQMDHLSMSFGPVGMALEKQSMNLLEVRDWKYITALNPLSAYSSQRLARPDDATLSPAWWATLLRRQNWQINSVRLNNGIISLGRSADQWLRALDIHLGPLRMDQWAAVHVVGKIGDGDIALEGSWDVLGEINRFTGAVSVQHALPFFLNNWMLASGMPRLIRGRIFADFTIKDGDDPEMYRSSVKLKFLRLLAEMSPSPDDPLLTRIGFSTSDTLRRLEDSNGLAALQFENSGSWRDQPLSIGALGLSMQGALNQAILQQMQQEQSDEAEAGKQQHRIETRIRLHETGVLSLNERSRLFKAVRILRQHPNWVVDLIPHWTGAEFNTSVLKRVNYTQHIIERYLAHRRVGRKRIFPLWPSPENHEDGIGSIWISIGPPT